jgi:YggT family protein
MPGIYRGLADVLRTLLNLYTYVVLIAVVMTWFGVDPGNPLVRFFRTLTQPVFSWVRRRLPFVVVGAVDLSPLVVWLLIQFLQEALVGNLYRLGS